MIFFVLSILVQCAYEYVVRLCLSTQYFTLSVHIVKANLLSTMVFLWLYFYSFVFVVVRLLHLECINVVQRTYLSVLFITVL